MKHLLSYFLLCACLFSLTGCTAEPHTGQTSSDSGDYPIDCITIGTTMSIEKAVAGEYNYDVLSSGASQLSLVRQTDSGDYEPLLTDWETADGQTWTFTVRPGMCWSDGTPVDAADILFTLQYEDRQGSANLTDQTDSEGNVTPAKYTSAVLSETGEAITLCLASPNVRELSNLTSFRVLPRHLLQDSAAPSDAALRVSCGPYVLESFDRDAGLLTFAVNPFYPETPRVKTLRYRLFDSADTLYMALLNGDIDMVWDYSVGVSAAYLDILQSSSAVTLYRVSAASVPAVLGFNTAAGVFASEPLRKAVACALDYAALSAYVGSDQSSAANCGFAPPATLGYIDTPVLTTDTDRADAYMQEAGYHKNDAGLYVDGENIPFRFTLSYRADKTVQVSCAELIKTALERFGMGVTLEALDSNSYNAKTSNKFSGHHITMEAALYGFTAAGMGMGSGLGSIYVDGTHNVQGGCQVFDPDFQAILNRMSSAGDLDAYKQTAAALQGYYAEHVPLLALYWDSSSYAASAAYGGLTVDGVFGLNHVGNWFTIVKS